ncbi:MAG: hypothetical protein ABIS07_18000 [Dokdonella sp.]
MRGCFVRRHTALLAGFACALMAAPTSHAGDFSPGSVCELAAPAQTTATSFCNTSSIALPAAGAASTYPSTISVSGLSGEISEIKVRLLGVTYADTSLLQTRLVSPAGDVVALSGGFAILLTPRPQASAANWTFADTAADYGLFGDPIQFSATAPTSSASYLPRSFTPNTLPSPAPAALPSQLMTRFNNHPPNGIWSLFLSADTSLPTQPSGNIGAGWCLDVSTAAKLPACYTFQNVSGSLSNTDPTQTGRIFRDGRPTLCTYPKSAMLLNATPVHYEKNEHVNPFPQPICLTATADFSGCGGNQAALVLYDNFDSAHPEQGVLADSGVSTAGRVSFSTRLSASQAFSAVVHEVTPGAGCPAFTYRLESNTCLPPPPGDEIFANGFEGPPPV